MKAMRGRWFLIVVAAALLAGGAAGYGMIAIPSDSGPALTLSAAGAMLIAGGAAWLIARPEARTRAPVRSGSVLLIAAGGFLLLLPAAVRLPLWAGTGIAVAVPLLLLADRVRNAIQPPTR